MQKSTKNNKQQTEQVEGSQRSGDLRRRLQHLPEEPGGRIRVSVGSRRVRDNKAAPDDRHVMAATKDIASGSTRHNDAPNDL